MKCTEKCIIDNMLHDPFAYFCIIIAIIFTYLVVSEMIAIYKDGY